MRVSAALCHRTCRTSRFALVVSVLIAGTAPFPAPAQMSASDKIDLALNHTQPLEFPRDNRLPLFFWHLRETRTAGDARELAARGLVAVPSWTRATMENATRIAKIQNKLGLPAYAFAASTGDGFYRDRKTLHVGEQGNRFADTSHVARQPLGCPFEKSGWGAVAERIRECVKTYQRAGATLDGLWFDWEGAGPSEWNESWDASKKCVRCRKELGTAGLEDFDVFQRRIREIRSAMQRMFVDVVHEEFPRANVANYGVYPQGKSRYWWDWYERMVDEALPARREHRAVYRQWFPEFPLTGFSIGMPVVYGWDRIWAEYEFADVDYRWFYNMLLVFSDAAAHRPEGVPLVPFVNRFVQVLTMPGISVLPGESEVRGGITVSRYEVAPDAPKDTRWVLEAKRGAVPLSEEKYRELLWHIWLRGADGMYVWCREGDMRRELVPAHEVYAAALEYREFLEKGEPVTFEVPATAGPVVSALRLGGRILVRRTDFGDGPQRDVQLEVDGKVVAVPASASARTVVIKLD